MRKFRDTASMIGKVTKDVHRTSPPNFLARNAIRGALNTDSSSNLENSDKSNIRSSVQNPFGRQRFPIEDIQRAAFISAFGKLSAARHFSTFQQPPMTLADIGPSPKLKDKLEGQRREFWTDFLKHQDSSHSKVDTREYKEMCEELTKRVSDDLKSREVCRRFKVQELLDAAKNGYFQSTHQKSECAGVTYNERQLEQIGNVQLALFGYESNTSPDQRPLHAIATKDPYGELAEKHLGFLDTLHSLDDLGDVAFFFKPEVKKYSTVTGGDSLAIVRGIEDRRSLTIDAHPEPLEKPTYKILPVYVMQEGLYGSPRIATWDPRQYNDMSEKFQYYEVQIHRILLDQSRPLGPQDGARAVIGDPVKLGQKKTLELKHALDEYGIKCDIGKNKEDSQRLRREYSWISEAFGEVAPAT